MKVAAALTIILLLATPAQADYQIDYGDGTPVESHSAAPWSPGSHSAIASHSYAAPGIYEVTITADIDCDGNGTADATATDTIIVNAGNVRQAWDFGDNSAQVTSSQSPCATPLSPQSHSYASSGTYTATYRAIDDSGNLISDDITIEATTAPTCTTTRAGTDDFEGIGGVSDTNVTAVGKNGTIYNYDGANWNRVTSPTGEDLKDVFMLNASLGWAVGKNGTVIAWDGSAWNSMTAPTGEDLRGVWAYSATEVYVAGKKGSLYLWDGTSWTGLSTPAWINRTDLESVWGTAASIYALAKDGTIYTRDRATGATATDTLCVTPGVEFKDLWVNAAGETYLAAKKNAGRGVWLNDGAACGQETATAQDLEAVSGYGATVYAVGKAGDVTGYDGSSWNETTEGTEDLKGVWVSPTGAPYYAGKKGQVTVCTPPAAVVDHYEIDHDASALTCQPESVTIRACQDASCATPYTGTVTLTLSPAGWVGGDTITFTGGSATVSLRHTTAEDVTLGISSASPSAPYSCVQAGAAASCVMTFHDAGFAFTVPDQTAGKDSAAITIAAVRKDLVTEKCVPAFANRSENVDFHSTWLNPATGTMQMTVNGTAIATSSPGTPVPLTFDANGESTIVVNYPDAGAVSLDASFTGTGAEAGLLLTGSSSFVSSPAGLCVEATGTNSDCASGDATCTAFTAAANPFALRVKAVAWETAGEADTDFCTGNPVTPNYQATGIAISHTKIAPAGGSAGTIGTTSFDMAAADNGVHTMSQSASEVGVFRFTADPPAYLTAGDVIPASTSANIGRFIPARFTVSISPDPPTTTDACLTGGFTYLGQPFGYTVAPTVTITALSAAGNTTVNYDCGGFWKFSSSPWSISYSYGDSAAPAALSPASATATAASGSDSDCNGSASVTLSDFFTYARPAPSSPLAPFASAIDLAIPAAVLTDNDGVCYDPGTGCAGLARTGINGANLVHGQGLAANAYGPETATSADPLILPVSALSYDGTTWQGNSSDSCTSVNVAKGAETGITVNTPPTPLVLDSGSGAISLYPTADPAPPGGSAEIILDFPAWLEPDLTVEAYFGIYRGNDRIINWQEVIR